MKILQIILASILLLSSCKETAQTLAKEQLIGSYEGVSSVYIPFASLNLGMKDLADIEEGTFRIIEDTITGMLYIENEDGNIYIENIRLTDDGPVFNVCKQEIKDDSGESHKINGVSLFEYDGNEYNGLFNNDSNLITLSYQSMIDFGHGFEKLELPAIIKFDYNKIK